MRASTKTNFVHSLIAVLAGNGIYFLLMPHLPPELRHASSKVDVGTLLDFWICLIVFGIVKAVAKRRRAKQENVG
jgi:hypothetical protein